MEIAAGGLERHLRASVPLVVTALVVFVDLAPRPAGAGGGLAPFLTLAMVYFWSVYRPDLMTSPAVFAIGFIHDVVSGQPLGVTSFALLFGRAILLARRRFFDAKSFVVIWGLFLLWAPAVELLRYLVSAAAVGALVDPRLLVAQCLVTVALYPALSWVLVRLHAQVRVGGHAEP